MQCPQPECLARNHPSADHCHACGADLFAVQRWTGPNAIARFFFFAGGMLFTCLSLPEQEAAAGLPMSSGRPAVQLIAFIYLAFGKWPVALAAWAAGAVCLGSAWRARRDAEGSRTEDQATEVVLPPAVPKVHRAFGLGLLLVLSLFLVLAWLDVAPILAPSRGVPTTATWLALVTGLLLFALAWGVGKVGRHDPPQSIKDYWSDPDIRVRVFLVWFLIAALGMVVAVTYLLTGEMVALVATGSTLVIYWLCGPGEFTAAD